MSENKSGNYFPKTISKQQASDTGMAMVLILLLIGFFTKNDLYYKISIPVLVMNMAYPKFYHFFAIAWLGLAQILGTFVSKILLSVVYVLLVIPVAVFRRLAGKDTLLLKSFKKESSSVMVTRNHEFISADIDKPY